MPSDIISYSYDKDLIKQQMTIDQVYDLLEEWHAEPEIKGDTIISRTIDHNYLNDTTASHKLYYYNNSKLFVSFTGAGSFDIYQLVLYVKNREEGLEWELPQAVNFIAQRLGIAPKEADAFEDFDSLTDFIYLTKSDKIKEIKPLQQLVELKEYDGSFLKNLPRPVIYDWVQEGITKEIMDLRGICYDPKSNGVVIPHYDINNRLVGIRERSFDPLQIELFGKYRPAIFNGKMYNHQLSFNLYNINNSKDNIRRLKTAIVFEAEKATMQYASYFGEENDISVAICGSSFIAYQAWMLLQLGVEEIVIGLDKDYIEINSPEHTKLCKTLKNIHYKYSPYTKISFLFDTEGLLGYKQSPTDRGKDVFLELFYNRKDLYK